MPTRLSIVHLGFEDFRRPWAGGGSHRTHQINRHLAERHEVTVVCARYPGCRTRVEDGVRYVHAGPPAAPGRAGHFASLLGYFSALPSVVLRHRADLFVEDFASPFGSVGVPRWTRTPTVGVVQWLFAREKAAQYHLPFHWVEASGARSHTRMIAVSDDLAAQLRAMNANATIDVVANGVDDDLLDTPPTGQPRDDFVFLGRLEIAQKGLDVLLDAFRTVAGDFGGRLLIAGDGADRTAIERRIALLGLTDRVRLLGRMTGADKIRLLDGARALLVPSRYETFGIVAAEALARRTPVIAFNIPCLRDVVTPGTGRLVATDDGQFSPSRFAHEVRVLARDPELARRLGEQGPAAVARYRWSAAAEAQEAIYLAAASRVGAERRAPVAAPR